MHSAKSIGVRENQNPVISIITITYNNANGLQMTIDSIPVSQTNIEQVIIDGGSSDESLLVLQNSVVKRNYIKYKSENDNGIYDAMNKGLELSRGEYVIFMNAGDRFYSDSTIDELLKILNGGEVDIVYGETMIVDQLGVELGIRSKITTRHLPNDLTVKSFRKGMVVCHQSFIVKKAICCQFAVNNLSADYDWMIKCVRSAGSIKKFNGIISSYLAGGISENLRMRSLIDRLKVMIEHYGLFQAILVHLGIVNRWVHFKFRS